MRVLHNKCIHEISHEKFTAIASQYRRIVVDLGTGSGRFVYKNAKKDKDCLYVGIDPAAECMQAYAARAAKKPSKGGLSNVLYLVSNIESIPEEIYHTADHITVYLPWGGLRDGLIKAEAAVMHNIVKLGKVEATVDIVISYSSLYEQGEVNRRQLPTLGLTYLSQLKLLYSQFGLNVLQISMLNNDQLKQFETDWAKKLAFGRLREIYRLQCQIFETTI